MTSPTSIRPFDHSTVRQFPESPGKGTTEPPNARTTEPADLAALAARSAVAKALALALAPPRGATFDFLVGGLARKVTEAAAHLEDGPALRAAAETLARAAAEGEGLAAEHQRLFYTEMAATPYETEYGRASAARKGPALADVLGFYEAFGFRPAPAAVELPDHIGAELEFLGLLLLKDADARGRGAADEAAVAEDAARKFFADHLGSWAPAFCRRLREAARHSFYAAVADLLQAFLDGEAARLGCEMGGFAGLGPEPAEDCLACPMAPPAPPDVS